MYTLWELKKYDNTSDGKWDETPEVLTSYYDVQVNLAMGGGKEGFSFKIPNTRNTKNREVKPLDIIEVYYLINGSSSGSTNFLMSGLVRNISLEKSGNNCFLRVECESFGNLLTQALVFYDPGDTTQNVMQYLKGCLDSVGLRNKNFKVTWSSTNSLVYKSDGVTLLPTFTSSTNKKRDYDKSFKKLIDDYLVNDYTSDGGYYWFVNASKELMIRKRTNNETPGDVQLVQGIDFENLKVRTNGDDVKNFIVIKCGKDWNGNPVSARYDDLASRAKHGFKYHLMIDNNLAEEAKKEKPSSTNKELIELIKFKGEAKAKRYAELHNKGYLEISAQTKPRLDIIPGNNVLVTINSYPNFNSSSSIINKKLMRVRSVQVDRDGLLIDLKEEAV